MYIPDVAHELQIKPEQGAFLLSITGITNTVSRMLCGFLVYRFPILSPILLLAGICGVGGILSFFVFLFTSYASLAIYAAIVGFVYGMCFSFISLFSLLSWVYRYLYILLTGPVAVLISARVSFIFYLFQYLDFGLARVFITLKGLVKTNRS